MNVISKEIQKETEVRLLFDYELRGILSIAEQKQSRISLFKWANTFWFWLISSSRIHFLKPLLDAL